MKSITENQNPCLALPSFRVSNSIKTLYDAGTGNIVISGGVEESDSARPPGRRFFCYYFCTIVEFLSKTKE